MPKGRRVLTSLTMSRATAGLVAGLLVLALGANACGDDDAASASVGGSTEPTASITSREYLGFREQPVACGADAPEPAVEMTFAEPTDLGLGSDPLTAIVHTSCGPVTIDLDPELAPATVNSFVFLAEQGYFDGTVSHRVYPGFMIQAGDPTATGRGGPGYDIPDEFPSSDFAYERGVVAMANAGVPNSGGSQFFVVLADYPLPPTYSVFGHVVDGMDALDRIAQVPLTARTGNPEVSSPLETVYIERIEIVR